MRLSDRDLNMYKNNGTAKTMEASIENFETEARNHPFYGQFVKEFRNKLNIQEEQSDKLWKKLLQAYKVQGKRVPGIRENNNITTIDQYMTAINDNKDFKDWVDEVCSLCGNALKVPEGNELALWTGGYAVSKEAQDLGYCTLEKTLLGDIFNRLPVTVNWDREEALWNILSKKFVSQYKGKRVHIYFRNVDEYCVLFLQEIPMIKEKHPPIEVVWHPLITNHNQISEVGYVRENTGFMGPNGTMQIKTCAINLDKNNRLFCCKSDQIDENKIPFIALAQQIRKASPVENNFTLTHFRSEIFHPDHAPFAQDSERFVGRFVNDFVQKFWKKETK